MLSSEMRESFIMGQCFAVRFSFPKRINMKRLIELGIIADVDSAPRGFKKISKKNFHDIIKEAEVNESYIVY